MNSKKFESFFSGLAGQFTAHIRNSIPKYEECEIATIKALTAITKGNCKLLDIGASEGTFSMMLNNFSGNKFDVYSLDPNHEMQKTFQNLNHSKYNKFIKKAFGEGFDEFEQYYPTREYDVIRESMTFQFISPDRLNQFLTVSNALKEGGFFITQSKCFKYFASEYQRLEAIKDEYKQKSFTEQEMSAKKSTILEAMEENMILDLETETALRKAFLGSLNYWNSCNFHGWIAYNDEKGRQKAIEFIKEFNKNY